MRVRTRPKVTKERGEVPKPSIKPQKAHLIVDRSLTLPTERSEELTSITQASFLIYGRKKIGKTSLTGEFPSALHLMCEPGGKGLRLFKRDVTRWQDLKTLLRKLYETDTFQTVVIDTADKAFRMCWRYVCANAGVDHPKDVPYGAGWDMLTEELSSTFDELLACGRGVVFISHAREREVETHEGDTVTRIYPTLTERAYNYFGGAADVVGYYWYHHDDRYLTILGSQYLEAGNRLKYNFRTPKGKRVHSIPMGEDEVESFANIEKAFANLQPDTGKPEVAPSLPVAKPVFGKKEGRSRR